MLEASSDRYQYLQQVKHYNCLIKSLESSLRNATATFGPDSEQAHFCQDIIRQAIREAAMIGVTYGPVEDEAMNLDSNSQAESASDDVTLALQELRQRMASVRIR